MNETWNKTVIQALVKNIKDELDDRDIKSHYEGQHRTTASNSEVVEIRIIQAGWSQIDATTWRTRMAVNLLCTVPSGENIKAPTNLYRIEELLGICQYILSLSVSIEGLGCLTAGGVIGEDMTQFRPRQITTPANVIQGSVTGYYSLEIKE
jgi:hypothetical protein